MMRFKDSKSAKKFWIVVIFLVVVAGSFLVAYPLVSKANAAADAISQAEDTKIAAQKKVDEYQSYKANYDDYVALDEKVSTKFPASMNGVRYSLYVQQSAARVGIPARNIESMEMTQATMEGPTLGTAAPAAGGAAPAADPAAAPAADPAADPAAADAAAGGDAAAAPAAAESNIASADVTISVKGTIGQLNSFVEELMAGGRDFTLVSYAISEGEDGATAQITGTSLLYRDLDRPATEEETPAE